MNSRMDVKCRLVSGKFDMRNFGMQYKKVEKGKG